MFKRSSAHGPAAKAGKAASTAPAADAGKPRTQPPTTRAFAPSTLNGPATQPPPMNSAAEQLQRRVGDRRRSNRRGTVRSSDESSSARIRLAQHEALLQGAPIALGASLLMALLIAARAPSVIDDLLILGWLAGLVTLTLVAVQAWWQQRHAGMPRPVSRRRLRLVIGAAALAGALWGNVPALVYLRADPALQAVVATFMFGALGGGAITLAALPQAVYAYVGLMTIGAVQAFALVGGGFQPFLLGGWVALAALIVERSRSHAAQLRGRALAEAHSEHQQDLIGLLLRDFEDAGSDMLWETDATGCLVEPSRRLAEALGRERASLGAQPLAELFASLQQTLPDQERDSADTLAQRLTEGQPFRDLMLPLMVEGQLRWWSMTAKPVLDERGTGQGWRGVARDVTQARLSDRRLTWMAHYDPLTGLVNRSQFRLLLEQAMTARPDERDGARGALLCLDLDDFKRLNDTLGPAIGDALLVEVARRLKAAVGRIDLVGRLAGDEFAVLLRHLGDAAEVRAVADRIAEALASPIPVQGTQVALHASLGAALFPQDGASVDELMQHADFALYEAKTHGRGGIQFYQPRMGEHARQRVALERDLRSALANHQLTLHYQPKVDLARWRVVGFEALLRWQHPEHGDVPPTEVIRVAEASGLMPELGAWVLGEACRTAAHWPRDVRLAVNLSAVQVMAQDLPEQIAKVLAASHLGAERLELEITENVLLRHGAVPAEHLQALKRLGVTIALDDFGTGFSSLAQLRRFPFDTLKIDRAFVREVLVSKEARSVVRNILALARSMHMTTVAEGVEEPAQLKALDAEGCGQVQGFCIARPMPASEVDRFLIGFQDGQRPYARRHRSSEGQPHRPAHSTPPAQSALPAQAAPQARPSIEPAPTAKAAPSTAPSAGATTPPPVAPPTAPSAAKSAGHPVAPTASKVSSRPARQAAAHNPGA